MYVITGVSSGIGHALASFYLEKGKKVVGIGRKNVINHVNYTFISCDLSSKKAVTSLDISFLKEHQAITWVNNAGILGEINRASQIHFSEIEKVMQVNTFAPIYFIQQLAKHFPKEKELTIVNISSGAAQRPIPSWAAYCASKAALERFSQTFYLEERELKRNIKMYSIAPGVVDTKMQSTIRSTPRSTFSALDSFIKLKDENELTSPKEVAKKLEQLLNMPYSEKVVYSLRDL